MAGERVHVGAVLLAVALGWMISSSEGVTLNLQNQCGNTLTIYWEQGSSTSQTDVASQGSFALDVGPAWAEGSVWAGNPLRSQVNPAEFTIVENGQDTYDISNVNAYNLGIEIQPVTPNGALCEDIKCIIPNLSAFCTPDNQYFGPGDGTTEYCINTDGPQPPEPSCCCPTVNTEKFKNACHDAFSFSEDNPSSQFNCDLTDYNIIFCPSGESSNNNLPCPQSQL